MTLVKCSECGKMVFAGFVAAMFFICGCGSKIGPDYWEVQGYDASKASNCNIIEEKRVDYGNVARLQIRIAVEKSLDKNLLKSTCVKVIKDSFESNKDLDAIIVHLYFLGEDYYGLSRARAEWAPEEDWGKAENTTDRSNYKVSMSFALPEKKVKKIVEEKATEKKKTEKGLSLGKRKEIFYELVQLQDSIPFDDPNYNVKNQETYDIIAKKYGISRSEAVRISSEGIREHWPMPRAR